MSIMLSFLEICSWGSEQKILAFFLSSDLFNILPAKSIISQFPFPGGSIVGNVDKRHVDFEAQ